MSYKTKKKNKMKKTITKILRLEKLSMLKKIENLLSYLKMFFISKGSIEREEIGTKEILLQNSQIKALINSYVNRK